MRLLTVLILASFFVGCATIPQGIAPTAKPLVSEEGETNTYKIVGKSEGSASHFSLFSFIPFGRADIDEAIQNTLAPLNGDNLINTHYYVTSTWLLIGNSIEITVKGDVIKYTGAVISKKSRAEQKSVDKSEVKKIDSDNTVQSKREENNAQTESEISKSIMVSLQNFFYNTKHKVTLGSAVQGFAVDYTLIKPINKFLFYSFGIGYKNVSYEDRNYYYYYDEWRTYTNDYSVLPITVNVGITGKTFLEKENLPINPYASFGLSVYLFDALGYNLNLGAVYEIPELQGIGVGLEYQYFDVFTGWGNGFSNLNLSFVFKLSSF